MAGFKEFPPDFEELYDVQMYIGISSTPTKAQICDYEYPQAYLHLQYGLGYLCTCIYI